MNKPAKSGPLEGAKVMAFAAVKDLNLSRAFYEKKLGLRVLSIDEFALTLECAGILIRLQKIPAHQAVEHTVLGWQVADLRSQVKQLAAGGIEMERYDFMKFQDETGVATFPNGDLVAWFKDPDGNVLSLAQFAG